MESTDIPINTPIVAGYVDGTYRWSDADWGRFPDAVHVRIAVLATTNDGHVLDVEQGNATPDQAPAWVAARRAAGFDPTVYVNLANVQAVRAAFVAAGVPEPHYWLAHYDNDPTIPPGYVAKQYANPPLAGAHYDASSVADFWPGVDTLATAPARIGQSADLVLAIREVGHLQPIFRFVRRDGTTFNRGIDKKVVATKPGRYIVTCYPPVDPDADETMALDDVATFVVDVKGASDVIRWQPAAWIYDAATQTWRAP